MKLISSTFCIIKIFTLIIVVRPDFWSDDVVEKFYWTPKNDTRNIQWEFSIVGRRVSWNVGKILCSSQNSLEKSTNEKSIETILKRGNSITSRRHEEIGSTSRLAILEGDDVRLWLAKMLSESNYHYNGLWIGGYRKESGSNWTWLGAEEQKENAIESSLLLANYPEWYKNSDVYDDEPKNCLIFDRMGHNMPVLLPTDCQLRKSFVCSRIVTKKNPPTIIEGTSVSIDGYRYTIFSVDEDNEIDTRNIASVSRLNGGGVKWIDARLECRKRGQYLAMVMSNEAAKKIGLIMLKHRPSMESVWLSGWSTDGSDWMWSSTGVVLPSKQSSTSGYPPWLIGHPIESSDENYQRHGSCLILDRHLCPDKFSPVFLDLDCDKKRPFVCQDGIPEDRSFSEENSEVSVSRRITVNTQILEFSTDRVTWNEGQAHCAKQTGKIASIPDSKTLFIILEKMADLYLDHIWVGGRTVKTDKGWKWFDETGKALTRMGIGAQASWCVSDDESPTLPIAEADNCLNLDREVHNLPIFYGLSCNFTRQHVLCSFHNAANSTNSTNRRLVSVPSNTTVKSKIDNKKESSLDNNSKLFENDLSKIAI